MPKKEYVKLEEHVINTFRTDRLFTYKKKLYELVFVGKPRPQGNVGECKTDVFVRAKEKQTDKIEDIKISIKKNNKEFLGNKLKAEEVEKYLGEGWEDILVEATTSLEEKFKSTLLLYAAAKYPTKPNSITVGWKLEITDRPRTLSVPIPLTDREIRDYIYKGTNLSEIKKDSVVEGEIIKNSGIAEYLLTTTKEQIKCSNDIINQMVDIDKADIGETYFAFTANNYRTDVDKADGKRYLAVRIEWKNENSKLIPVFLFDNPLKYNGGSDMAPFVKESLKKIGKHNISELIEYKDVDYQIWRG